MKLTHYPPRLCSDPLCWPPAHCCSGRPRLAEILASKDEFTGYGRCRRYAKSNGNTLDVVQAGHTIRDGVYDSRPKDVVDTGETYDCVIVRWRNQRSCRRSLLSAPIRTRIEVSDSREPCHLWRRGQAKRISGGRQAPDCASGLRYLSASISAQLSCPFLRLDRTQDSETRVSKVGRTSARDAAFPHSL